MYTKQNIYRQRVANLLWLSEHLFFFWWSWNTISSSILYENLFMWEYFIIYCGGKHVLEWSLPKLQVKAWQLVKPANRDAGSKKLVSVLSPEEFWNCYHSIKFQWENHHMSLKTSNSLQFVHIEFLHPCTQRALFMHLFMENVSWDVTDNTIFSKNLCPSVTAIQVEEKDSLVR